MTPSLTLPGLGGGVAVEAGDRPALLDRLLGERDDAPAARGPQPDMTPARPAAGGGMTLDELLVGTWNDLTAHRTAHCPACSEAAMAPRYGAGAEPVGGRCGRCGTTLA